jgi:hypothetical protein
MSLTDTIRSSLMLSCPPGTEGSQGLVSVLGAVGGSGGVPAAGVGCREASSVGLHGW